MLWLERDQPTSRAVHTYFPKAPASVFGLRCVLAQEEQGGSAVRRIAQEVQRFAQER